MVRDCGFTDEELKILEGRRKGKSVCSMSLKLNLSERTIKRRIKAIHKKILREL